VTQEEIERATAGMVERASRDFRAGETTFDATVQRYEAIFAWRDKRRATSEEVG
jgi:hypothetical protein